MTIEEIRIIYEKLNNKLLFNPTFHNSKIFREKFRKKFQNKVTGIYVKCDEENNSPEIIDMNCLVARLFWVENNILYHADLVFGDPNQIRNISISLFNCIKVRHD
jgi:hypothetical protein